MDAAHKSAYACRALAHLARMKYRRSQSRARPSHKGARVYRNIYYTPSRARGVVGVVVVSRRLRSTLFLPVTPIVRPAPVTADGFCFSIYPHPLPRHSGQRGENSILLRRSVKRFIKGGGKGWLEKLLPSELWDEREGQASSLSIRGGSAEETSEASRQEATTGKLVRSIREFLSPPAASSRSLLAERPDDSAVLAPFSRLSGGRRSYHRDRVICPRRLRRVSLPFNLQRAT